MDRETRTGSFYLCPVQLEVDGCTDFNGPGGVRKQDQYFLVSLDSGMGLDFLSERKGNIVTVPETLILLIRI